MLGQKGDLSAAEIAFYAPALVISAYVVFRHGFKGFRQLGWFYLCTLSILRIVGASAYLYMVTNNTYNTSLIETYAICSSIGTAPLLLALLGFLERIHQNMELKGMSLNMFRPIHLLALAGLIVVIIGGTDEGSSSVSTQKTGTDLREAGCVVFLVVYLALAAITLYTMANTRYVAVEEITLLRAAVLALPFLAVRLAYTVATGFAAKGSVFYYTNANVWLQAFMQFLMEAIVVCLYIFAGLMTPRVQHKDVEGRNVEMLSGPKQEQGYVRQQSQDQAPHQQRAPRQSQFNSIGDYRPSKMLRNGLRN